MIPEDLKGRKSSGGRPALHSLAFTLDEILWVQKTMARRAQLVPLAKKSPKKLKESVLSLNDKLAVLPQPNELDMFVINMSRDELQVLNQIVSVTAEALKKVIIPQYEQRHAGSERLEQVRLNLKMLDALALKGERVFNNGSHRRGNTSRRV